jgi:hypothetical protein
MNTFTWWQVVDGVARPVEDNPTVRAQIDNGTLRNIYGSIEGAIINGGVQATAFKRKYEQTYDTAQWLATGAMVPMGFVQITEITAEPVAL